MEYYASERARSDYSPPLLGNGELALELDFEGVQTFQGAMKEARGASGPCLWWAGRRYRDTSARELIPFGHLRQRLTRAAHPVGAPQNWRQGLDPIDAYVASDCVYEPGLCMRAESFLHAQENILAMRRRYDCADAVHVEFSYCLTDEAHADAPRRLSFWVAPFRRSVEIRYEADGQDRYRGVILLLSDAPLAPSVQGNRFTLKGLAPKGAITFFLIFADDLYGDDPEKTAARLARLALEQGYDGLFSTHRMAWRSYHAQSRVELPDAAAMRAYRTAGYHLKCHATRWSIPAGIKRSAWDGHYFAFDEYFAFIGLLTGNHRELARRVPEFRFQGLPAALARASYRGARQARYPWAAVETGEEAAPPGCCHDHVFHMAHITRGAWEFFQYTRDETFLRERAYPMISACANFYLLHMLYELGDGRLIVGASTDLEPLGASRQNAYMTTCAVADALRIAGEAARALAVDEAFAAACRAAAERLLAALPGDGAKYVPYPGCPQRGVCMLSGAFPYPVLERGDAMQRRAMDDYCAHEGGYGSRYEFGHRISTWYALWKAIAYCRLGEAERAGEGLRQAIESLGCFFEAYEVNEPGCRLRPWFSPAAGACLQAIHEMLLLSRDGALEIGLGARRAWTSFAFELPAKGNLTVRARVAEGELTEFEVASRDNARAGEAIEVSLPDFVDCARMALENGWRVQSGPGGRIRFAAAIHGGADALPE